MSPITEGWCRVAVAAIAMLPVVLLVVLSAPAWFVVPLLSESRGRQVGAHLDEIRKWHAAAASAATSKYQTTCPATPLAHAVPPRPSARLTRRTQPQMTLPLGSAPITGASRLLRAGPPARLATVLSPSRFRPLGRLPLTTPTRAAVSRPAFSRSTQTQQTRLTSPLRWTPPGQ